MDPDRWEEIKRIYNSALEFDLDEQEGFLSEACGGDSSLRNEVEILLAQQRKADGFMKAPAMEVAAHVMAKDKGGADIESLAGQIVAHYRIVEKIGEGGMGVVYRAQDTRLNRDVAIKSLPDIFAADPSRLARFEREAKILATLNHPNIASVYGLEESDGKRFLVMELVEGKTLAQRLLKGPLPVEEALQVCCQIAEGLEAAHEKGIIHRDLKPGNVMVTTEGKVKILDFGLSKALAGESQSVKTSHSPTNSEALTRAGTILGTAAYISPEQAKGKPVDKRADIWAYGCVLFECLTGKRVFEGETITETLAAILKGEPDWRTLPDDTPRKVKDLIHQCLQKDANERLHDIADARIEIREAVGQVFIPEAGGGISHASKQWLYGAVGGSLVIVVLMGFGLWRVFRPPPIAQITSYIKLEKGYRLGETWDQIRPWCTAMAIAGDGRRIIYSAMAQDAARTDRSIIFVREVGQLEARRINGTDGARGPFLSPDDRWVGFWANGKLMKMPIEGGIPAPLCEIPAPFGACWSEDGRIAFAPGGSTGLSVVPAAGGKPEELTKPDRDKGEYSHRLPYWLPGGKGLLFTIMGHAKDPKPNLALVELKSKTSRVLIEDAADPRLTITGHLLFARRGSVMAVQFDADKMQLVGQPVPVITDVMQSLNTLSSFDHIGAAQFSISGSGSLVYSPGGIEPDKLDSLVWVDHSGKSTEVTAAKGRYHCPRLSPDGKRITYQTHQKNDVWIHDIMAGTAIPLTTDGLASWPIWRPGGAEVTFTRLVSGGRRSIYQARADGTGKLEQLTTSENPQLPGSWSPDGKVLAFTESTPATLSDILLFRPEDGSVKPFLSGKFNEGYPEFSPDGRFLAFTSNESGREQVYVTPFPGPGPKVPVTIEGGWQPFWARSGKQIFFCRQYTQVWVADVIRTEPIFQAGRLRLLFEHPGYSSAGGYSSARPNRAWDISLDDRLFLTTRTGNREISPVTEMILVQNWFEELKRLCPTK